MRHYIYEEYKITGDRNVSIKEEVDIYSANTFIRNEIDYEYGNKTIGNETELDFKESQHLYDWSCVPKKMDFDGVICETFPIVETYEEDGQTIENTIYNYVYEVIDLNTKRTGQPIFNHITE